MGFFRFPLPAPERSGATKRRFSFTENHGVCRIGSCLDTDVTCIKEMAQRSGARPWKEVGKERTGKVVTAGVVVSTLVADSRCMYSQARFGATWA